MKIASLLPSCTEIACSLGLSENIIGISHECDFPKEIKCKPVLTSSKINPLGTSYQIDKDVMDIVMQGLSVYNIDEEKLKELNPDIILTQDQCEVCAVSLKDVQKAVKSFCNAKIISLKPEILTDIFSDIKKIASETNKEKEAEELIHQLYSRINYIKNKTKNIEKPRVCIIEWISPLMVAGNWTPELIEIAGGENVLGEHGKHSKKINMEEIINTQPDKIIIIPCGFKINQTINDIHLLTSENLWHELKAVKNNEIYIVDGNSYLNRPSQRIVDTLEILSSIIHPELFHEKKELAFKIVYKNL